MKNFQPILFLLIASCYAPLPLSDRNPRPCKMEIDVNPIQNVDDRKAAAYFIAEFGRVDGTISIKRDVEKNVFIIEGVDPNCIVFAQSFVNSTEKTFEGVSVKRLPMK